ncbi:MAG: DUF1653 domain-containing protein [bacterium]|nr:DUF1653 domain-containing protein [bacterium]
MLKRGVYQHYKNGLEYLLVGIGKHEETEEDYVIYQALYGERQIWIRALTVFAGHVELDDEMVSRYEWIRDAE